MKGGGEGCNRGGAGQGGETLDFISLTLHLAFMGWLDTRGRGRWGCGGVYGHVALLGYDCEKGARIKPFTRATLWIISLTTLRVQRGGG